MYKQLNYFLLLCLVLLLNNGCGSVAQQTGNRPQPVVAPPVAPPTQQTLKWSGTLDITNAKRYRTFLRDYQICDPYSLFNLGTFSCEAWDNRASVSLTFHKQELPAQITLTIWPILQHWSSGSRPIPSFTPIPIIGDAHYIDDFSGFQARFTGRVGIGALSPVIVKSTLASGSIYDNDRIIEVDLFYGGSTKEDLQFGSAELENPAFTDNLEDRTRQR